MYLNKVWGVILRNFSVKVRVVIFGFIVFGRDGECLGSWLGGGVGVFSIF